VRVAGLERKDAAWIEKERLGGSGRDWNGAGGQVSPGGDRLRVGWTEKAGKVWMDSAREELRGVAGAGGKRGWVWSGADRMLRYGWAGAEDMMGKGELRPGSESSGPAAKDGLGKGMGREGPS
jgi:hypothetical protein